MRTCKSDGVTAIIDMSSAKEGAPLFTERTLALDFDSSSSLRRSLTYMR